MKLRNTIIAFILLCLAFGALYFMDKREDKRAKEEEAQGKIANIPKDDISVIKIKNQSGDFVFERSESETAGENGGNWRMILPVQTEADSANLENLLENLSNLKEKRSFQVKDEELRDFGLYEPVLAVEIKDSKSNSQTLYLGEQNPDGSMQYVLSDPPKTAQTPTSEKSQDQEQPASVKPLKVKLAVPSLYAFRDKTLTDLRNKNLFSYKTEDVAKIRAVYARDKFLFSLEKRDEDYFLTEPFSAKADKIAVSRFVNGLLGTKAQDFSSEDYSKNPAQWGFDKPYASIEFELYDGNKSSLFIGRKSPDGDYFYARSGKNPAVAQINESLKNDLSPSLSGIINKRISDDWEKDEVASFAIVSQGKSEKIEKSGELWILSGKRDLADQARANGILQKLKGLVAEEYVSQKPKPEHSLEKPHLLVTITGKEGGDLAEYKFGKYEPVNKMYVMGGSDNYVYKISSSVPEQIKKDFPDLRNRKLSVLKRYLVEEIGFSNDKGSVVFAKNKDGDWEAKSSGGIVYAPDKETAKKHALKALDFAFENKISAFVDVYADKDSGKEFGFDSPTARLTLKEKDGDSDTVLIGKADPVKEYAYAKISSRDNVYKVKVQDINEISGLFEKENDE